MNRARPWWLVPACIYAAVAIAFLVWAPENRAEFPLDDAWIHRVYARSFAFGHGFAYNDAQEAGCTSPLWAIVTAPIHWLGSASVVWGVKLFGVALGALSVLAIYTLARRYTDATWPAALAASLFACEPALAFSALSGMEVELTLCLWLWLVVAIETDQLRFTTAMLALLPVARPEAVLLAGLGVLVLALRRRLRWWMIVALVPTLAWVAFCELATGHPLPNTYYLKAAGDLAAVAKVPRVLFEHGWARSLVVPVIGVVALAVWCRRAALLAIGSLGFVIAVVASREYLPLGYYWTRWTDPGVLGFAAACALGVAIAAHRLAGIRRIAVIIAIAGSAPLLVASIAERATRLGTDGHVIARMNVEPGRWIAAHTPADAVIGVNDAGALRYFGNRTTIDLVGLNAKDVAFHRLSREAIEQRAGWIAIYPIMGQLYPAFARYTHVRWFSIPREQYTICDCNGPTDILVARRADGRAFTAEQHGAMVGALRATPATAWLAADAGAAVRADELAQIFTEAGWRVAAVEHPAFRLHAGLFLFAADDPPAASVAALRAGLDAAGLDVTFGAGYRAFLAEQPRTGSLLELAPDQAFVLAVGPEP